MKEQKKYRVVFKCYEVKKLTEKEGVHSAGNVSDKPFRKDETVYNTTIQLNG